MPEQGSICVQQWRPHIADGTEGSQIRVVRKELQQALRKMRAGFCFNHRLARCSVDGMFVMFKKTAIEPKRQSPKPSCFGQVLGYPGAAGLQRFTEVSDKRSKKVRTRFRHCALDKKPQNLVFSNPWTDGLLKHDRHEENLRPQTSPAKHNPCSAGRRAVGLLND